jgi:hypothetical protein
VRAHALALALLLTALGCRTETTESPAAPEPAVITHGAPTRAWRVVEGERTLGWVVRFDDPAAPRRSFFSVRDPDQHDLGLIDLHGRFWRYRAHAEEPDWLGTGTVREGAIRILGASDDARLEEAAAPGA